MTLIEITMAALAEERTLTMPSWVGIAHMILITLLIPSSFQAGRFAYKDGFWGIILQLTPPTIYMMAVLLIVTFGVPA